MEALRTPEAVRAVFAIDAGDDRLAEVVASAHASGIPTHAVSEPVMGHLTSTVTPQGIVAVCSFVDVPLDSLRDAGGCVVVLAEVRDPGNAGTILRSADAAGAAGVVFSRSSVDVYNAKAVRASAGSIFHVPVVRELDVAHVLDALRAAGRRVVGASADGRVSVYDADLAGPVAVVFGNEAHGLAGDLRSQLDDTIRVPIHGAAESLNLAAAATIVLFEAARQRSARR
jgi:TrmH family RNA methyltransferase